MGNPSDMITRILPVVFVLGVTLVYGQSYEEILKHRLMIEHGTTRALQITDVELKAAVTHQLNHFHNEFGDSYTTTGLYKLNYETRRGLIRQLYLDENPLHGKDVAYYRADSSLNMFIGHFPDRRFETSVAVRSVHFASNGISFYSSGGDGRLLQWDITSREFNVIYEDEHLDQIVGISPDEQRMALSSHDDELTLLDLSRLPATPIHLRGHRGAVYDLCFLRDGRMATAGADHRLLLHSLEGDILELAQIDHRVTTLAVTSDDKTLIGSGAQGRVTMFDVASGTSSEILRDDHATKPVTDLALSNDDRYLAIGGFSLETGVGYVQVLDLENQQPYGPELIGFESVVTSVSFSPTGKWVAASCKDKTARVWRMDGSSIYAPPLVLDDHMDWVWDLSFHPLEREILTASADGIIRKFPLTPNAFFDQLCTEQTRNLTPDEWRTYIGKPVDFPYRGTCPGMSY